MPLKHSPFKITRSVISRTVRATNSVLWSVTVLWIDYLMKRLPFIYFMHLHRLGASQLPRLKSYIILSWQAVNSFVEHISSWVSFPKSMRNFLMRILLVSQFISFRDRWCETIRSGDQMRHNYCYCGFQKLASGNFTLASRFFIKMLKSKKYKRSQENNKNREVSSNILK